MVTIWRFDSIIGAYFFALCKTNQPDWMRYKGSAKAGNITLTGGFSVELYWNFQMMLNFRLVFFAVI